MTAVKTVQEICLERGIEARRLAEPAGVAERRVGAIILGRWTPSPSERDAIAGAFAAIALVLIR